MHNKRTYCLLAAGMLALFFLSACWVYSPPWLPKKTVEAQSLLGEWHLTYPDNYVSYYVSDPIEGTLVISGTTTYLVRSGEPPVSLAECGDYLSPLEAWWWKRCPLLRGPDYVMQGEESLTLYADGTYDHTFRSGAFSYVAPRNRWALISDAVDAPKLRMEGLKYFAEGAAQASSSVEIALTPQTLDQLRIQEWRESHNYQAVKADVIYPTDGFLYLYVRVSDGRLSLVQMTDRADGFDDPSVTNPVFHRP